ncbi:hypothetical protein BDN72DRAFT_803478 [Pluteus cervinus]|uniref:Uncharacterized protein n=1 Tax=Pluteus cervinus TaxID=181527 RepID=A0ACD3ACQ1_9AGAR|nr:hypothetical protein BDN72DRAFT_803478 [Pluteus cervinus]
MGRKSVDIQYLGILHRGPKSGLLKAPVTRVAADAKSLPVIIQLPHGIGSLLQEAVRIQDDGYESESERVECVDSDVEEEHEEIGVVEAMGSTMDSVHEGDGVDAKESTAESTDEDDEPGVKELTAGSVDVEEPAICQPLQESSIRPKPKHLPHKILPRDEKERRRRNSKNHAKRRTKRITAAKGKVLFHYRFKRAPKGMSKALSTVKVNISAATDLAVSGGGSWLGKRLTVKRTTPWTLPELLARGFRYIDWEGKAPQTILDTDGRIIAALVGGPLGDTTWPRIAHDAYKTMQEILAKAIEDGLVPETELHHRRGNFLTLPAGVSYGGGQVRPGNLRHPPKIEELIQFLLKDKAIRRIAGFQTSAFAFYAPKIFREIQEAMNKLFGRYSDLERNFSNSIYPAVTFNCGPETACLEHVDHGNAPNSLCAITALGDFDWKKGGHLVLFSLGIVVPLPPGSLALISSATIRHGNTPIQPGEKRGSMTQYCAGGLLRWVAYGFQSARSLSTTPLGPEFIKKIEGEPGERWKRLLNSFSTWTELEASLRNKGDAQ